jgi:hypothetical protein
VHVGTVLDGEAEWPVVWLVVVPSQINFNHPKIFPRVVNDLKVGHDLIKAEIVCFKALYVTGCGIEEELGIRRSLLRRLVILSFIKDNVGGRFNASSFVFIVDLFECISEPKEYPMPAKVIGFTSLSLVIIKDSN